MKRLSHLQQLNKNDSSRCRRDIKVQIVADTWKNI